ncbi:DUF805 domain-containing protein [Paenibacillus sp. L3-i20]|uniref:DUF805 domain-containing protein n=1 Tax=Paenibacillus sp. L3-i20 TaxID=2905833 RepID=UPI001EDE4A4D|nr:DUF805 domain-containing protein [Paenibacillus sp. L3-i20]GKU77157.1 inner membrane protein YhaI [Paenibacillus sp. L3-i20]
MSWYTEVLKQYATFTGRARRKEYWMFVLFNAIIGLLLYSLTFISETLLFVYAIYLLAVLVPSLAVIVRRLHDTNRSGWWFFISFVPLVGGIILIVFMIIEGDKGTNQYGEDPKLNSN